MQPKCQSLVCLPQWRNHLISALHSGPDLPRFKRTLSLAITTGLWRHDPFVSSRLIAAFASSSDLPFAQLAFDSSHRPSAFSFNSMIRAHSAGPTPSSSLSLFRSMLRSGLHPDRFTFPFLFRASPSVSPSLHALSLRHGLAADPHVATSLLHSYGSVGLLDSALKVFDEMPERTAVTWNAMISCCARSSNRQAEGLHLFGNMLSGGAQPNADTFVGALSCCSSLGALWHGRSVHALALRRHVSGLSVAFATALIQMYARCGSLEKAKKAFETAGEKDASMCTAMIGGLAMHGGGEEALSLFDEMVGMGLAPDSLTFTSVLHACSHSGLVEEGIRVFTEMREKYGIEARMEHYGAMADLFGRAGRLDEAEKVVQSMPFAPNSVVWGSLLNALMVNEDELGYFKERLVVEIPEEGGGLYVGVSNVYAMVGNWDEVRKVRDGMWEKGVKKESGFSLVEVEGRVHKFLVGDTRHSLTMDIYILLSRINGQMVYL